MHAPKDEGASKGATHVSEPVAEIVSGALGMPALVPFVENPHAGQDDCDHHDQHTPIGAILGPEKEGGGKEPGTSEEVAEVHDLVRPVDGGAFGAGKRAVGQNPE